MASRRCRSMIVAYTEKGCSADIFLVVMVVVVSRVVAVAAVGVVRCLGGDCGQGVVQVILKMRWVDRELLLLATAAGVGGGLIFGAR